MPEVRCERGVDQPLDAVWRFVSDLDRWAPLMTGYERHTRHDDRNSTWVLRGDLGPMSRSVTLKVRITEWVDAERVAFELEGVDEAVSGGGRFLLSGTRPVAVEPPPRSWWQRLIDWLMRRPPALPAPTEPARSHVIFEFRIATSGPMAPMLDAMLGPYAERVAQDLLRDVGEAAAKEAA